MGEKAAEAQKKVQEKRTKARGQADAIRADLEPKIDAAKEKAAESLEAAAVKAKQWLQPFVKQINATIVAAVEQAVTACKDATLPEIQAINQTVHTEATALIGKVTAANDSAYATIDVVGGQIEDLEKAIADGDADAAAIAATTLAATASSIAQDVENVAAELEALKEAAPEIYQQAEVVIEEVYNTAVRVAGECQEFAQSAAKDAKSEVSKIVLSALEDLESKAEAYQPEIDALKQEAQTRLDHLKGAFPGLADEIDAAHKAFAAQVAEYSAEALALYDEFKTSLEGGTSSLVDRSDEQHTRSLVARRSSSLVDRSDNKFFKKTRKTETKNTVNKALEAVMEKAAEAQKKVQEKRNKARDQADAIWADLEPKIDAAKEKAAESLEAAAVKATQWLQPYVKQINATIVDAVEQAVNACKDAALPEIEAINQTVHTEATALIGKVAAVNDSAYATIDVVGGQIEDLEK